MTNSFRPPRPARLANVKPFDLAVVLLILALVVLVALTFGDYGISNDEEVQHRYGEMIIGYYASGLSDQTLFHFGNLYLYGGLFDIIAVLLAKALPFEPYAIRHVLSALIGLGGIWAAAATARLLAGPRAGFITALALAICGVWYGGMFNHTKDIPFAAAMMAAAYFLVRAVRDLPAPRLRHIGLFGLFLGAALGLRATGLLMFGYLALAIGLRAWSLGADGWQARGRFFVISVLRFVPAVVIAYAIMIAAWPWAALEPDNALRAIFAFAHFHYPIRTMLSGHVYEMGDVPRWYVPLYLAIKLPLIIWMGAAIAVSATLWTLLARGSGRKDRWDWQTSEIALLALMIVVPVTCQVIGHGPAFTGMRHFLFVVPPLAVLAAVGLDDVLSFFSRGNRLVATAAYAIVGLAILLDANNLVRLHPDEYLFFNSLVGGLEGASRRFDTDYWVNIMPEAVDDLQTFLNKNHSWRPGQRYSVAVCGERVSFEKEADPRLQITGDWDNADFFIAPTHMDCDRALDGKVVATIERMGVPIGVVKDRRALTQRELARAPRR